MGTFNKIEVIIGTAIILCSFFMALKVRKKNILLHLRFFYLYPLLALCLSIFTIINNLIFNYSRLTIAVVEKAYILLEPIFWGYFFLKLFHNKSTYFITKNIFIFSISLTIYLVITSSLENYNLQILSINNLSYVFYCSIYFFDLFKNEPVKKLKSEATFYIILGLFFYSSFSLPLFPVSDYFRSTNHSLSMLIIWAVNFIIIIMHLFFIKGYLCLIRSTKV
jgi:hypothetical protein